MPDMLANGAAWLAGQLKASAGRTVTITDGSQTISVTATIGSSRFEAANTSGVTEVWETRDFIVAPADLDAIGFPAHGWYVTDTIDGVDVVYAVRTPAGVPEWHYGDGFRQTVRIHTVIADSGDTLLTTEDGELLIT